MMKSFPFEVTFFAKTVTSKGKEDSCKFQPRKVGAFLGAVPLMTLW